MRNKQIMLSGRKYKIQDVGKGEPCILLIHQHCKSPISLSMLIEQIRDSHRLIILDITEYFPIDAKTVSEVELDQLIDDLHLLCDIYWLKKVSISSDYQPDLIQFKFKAQLSERYQSEWGVECYQPKEHPLTLH